LITFAAIFFPTCRPQKQQQQLKHSPAKSRNHFWPDIYFLPSSCVVEINYRGPQFPRNVSLKENDAPPVYAISRMAVYQSKNLAQLLNDILPTPTYTTRGELIIIITIQSNRFWLPHLLCWSKPAGSLARFITTIKRASLYPQRRGRQQTTTENFFQGSQQKRRAASAGPYFNKARSA
jgi:hypothetical protein